MAGHLAGQAHRASCSRFRELLHAHRDELAALITAEHGKVHSDALGEVARGLEVVEFACGIPHLLKGGFSENVSTRVDSYSIRQPLGVVAGITPFNFPAMVPMWMFPIAIAGGQHLRAQAVGEGPLGVDPARRAVAARPGCPTASSTSCTATRWRSTRLLDAPGRTRRVSFVGSTPIARYVYETRHRARQARAGARRRQEPHARAARRRPRPRRRRGGLGRASARRASAAWRSPSWSPSTRSATSWSTRSRSGSPG